MTIIERNLLLIFIIIGIIILKSPLANNDPPLAIWEPIIFISIFGIVFCIGYFLKDTINTYKKILSGFLTALGIFITINVAISPKYMFVRWIEILSSLVFISLSSIVALVYATDKPDYINILGKPIELLSRKFYFKNKKIAEKEEDIKLNGIYMHSLVAALYSSITFELIWNLWEKNKDI